MKPGAKLMTLGSVLLCAAMTPALGQLSNPAALNETAPATYKARFDTTKGAFVVEVTTRLGAERRRPLLQISCKNGFYDNVRFFRVISGFMVQFGISGDPEPLGAMARPPSTPGRSGDSRATAAAPFTYAMAGPNTRTTQVFINFGDNSALDKQGFAPFGQVVSGMNVVDSLYSGYGEGAPRGQGPDQGRIQQEGNAYLTKSFPKLDFVKKASHREVKVQRRHRWSDIRSAAAGIAAFAAFACRCRRAHSGRARCAACSTSVHARRPPAACSGGGRASRRSSIRSGRICA